MAAGKVSLSEVASDGHGIYWLESRPSDGGRVVCVRASRDGDGWKLDDISPPGSNIRSRVHEYGGGAWCLVPGHGPGAFAYVDMGDQRVWFVGGVGMAAVALTDETPAGERWAHGGLCASTDGDFVLSVRERHGAGGERPVRCIVALGARPQTAGTTAVLEGHDFFGAPALDGAGRRLVCAVWDHPDMQWDASAVVVAAVERHSGGDSGTVTLVPTGERWTVAGGPVESVGQPQWQGDGSVRFVSDRRGWWQPYRHSGNDDGLPPVPLSDEAAEFHGPDWPLGLTTMAELGDGRVVARRSRDGIDALVVLPATPGGASTTLAQPCVAISALCRHADGVAFIGATRQEPATVWVTADVGEGGAQAVRPRPAGSLPADDVSVGEPFEVTGHSGRPVYGMFYAPRLAGTEGPPGARPPLVVAVHGGPTSAASAGFDTVTQFFTTRGFAFATVDYAGSTGYGRDYRCSLWGQWGVFDAEDCVDAARSLADSGRVDGARMAIRGGSSGGLTALNALLVPDGFGAAASWYGVTDLADLAASTHDFEARYTDRLVGVLPEAAEVYRQRSPVHRAAELNGAVLLLQGTEDAMVPPSQAEGMRDALVAAGRPCRIHFFEGEGHGFRRADTLQAAYEAELAFYEDVFHL
jgi:dipeptidyl aminopeptidase/acylaminoacyl peptidase